MRSVRVPLAAALAGCLFSTLARPASADGFFARRAEASRLSDAGDLNGSVDPLDAQLERRPRDVEARIRRGNLHLRQNHPDLAIADFDVAIRYAPWSISAFVDRGIARVMLGMYEEAEADFRRATRLHAISLSRDSRTLAMAHCGLGQVAFRSGKNEDALREYGEAIRLNPSDPSGYLGRGETLAASKRLELAIADYTQAIQLLPTMARAYTFRGDALSLLGRDDEAMADFDAAIRLDPNDERAHSFRGSLLARRGENDRALEDFDEVIRLDPRRAAAYKDRGGVLVRLRRYEQAIKDLDESIRLDPRRATAYLNRGAAYNNLAQYERALDDLNEAVRLDPQNAGAHTNQGLALFALGKYDSAIASLSEAVRLDPKNASLFLNRAGAYARLGLADRAIEDYDESIRLDPNAVMAHIGLGNAHEALGRRDQAIREYDMAIRLSPSNPSVYRNRGNVRRADGDWAGAIEDYTRAVELNPRSPEAYVLRGWSRFSAGVDGADEDARAYLTLQERPDASTPYMAILGTLAARRAGREARARAFVDEALAKINPGEWPGPILRYLRREISPQMLLDSAYDDTKKTEAHAFLGVDQCLAGDLLAGTENLRWVCEKGVANTSAADLARNLLSRIDGPRAETARR